MKINRFIWIVLCATGAGLFAQDRGGAAPAPPISPVTGRPAPQADKDYEQWREAAGSATSAGKIHAPPGFAVELLRSALPQEGSWISMAFDPKGRMYLGVEGQWKRQGKGILRITFSAKSGAIEKIEQVEDTLLECRGLLWAHDSLYAQCNVGGGQGKPSGLYRLRDTDGDDRFDEVKLLRAARGGGHGLNDLALGPDGLIYMVQGDQSLLPEDWQPGHSPVRQTAQDMIAKASGEPNVSKPMPPQEGRLVRTDADGKRWEVVACGMRNPMGIDFNPDGEPFTYEADMEWDVGLPWYRPTHVIHMVSGTDYGWRQGSDPWPLDYPDRPPVNLLTGLGSPTAVKFGTRSRFPQKYREALFILDWAYGRILTVRTPPQGAGYRCEAERFVDGRPLNVTDLDFGPDGAMYFITGGRGTQSGLYRLRYEGPAGLPRPEASEEKGRRQKAEAARAIRRKLESFHGHTDPRAVDAAWPYLGSEDPWLRHAARIAIEAQPVETWQGRALESPAPKGGGQEATASLAALMALARTGATAMEEPLLTRLDGFDFASLDESQKLMLLRDYELCLFRMGRPGAERGTAIIQKFHAVYPDASAAVNRELARLLAYLGARGLVAKTLPLAISAPTHEQRLYFMNVLRHATDGWGDEQVKVYCQALAEARTQLAGRGYPGFIQSLTSDTLARMSQEQRVLAQKILDDSTTAPAAGAASASPRPFVKAWTMADLAGRLDQVGAKRDRDRGRRLFVEAACAQCHRMGQVGGVIGPDLSQVASRFGRADILRSILEPSVVIDEKYRIMFVTTRDGAAFAGTIVEENDQRLLLALDPLAGKNQSVPRSQIKSREPSPISPMPPGLLSTLTADEILDLLAYLTTGGS